jgi:hypothetical protein
MVFFVCFGSFVGQTNKCTSIRFIDELIAFKITYESYDTH